MSKSARRDCVADDVLQLRDLLFRLRQFCPRRRLDADDELPGVGSREERKAEQRKQKKAGGKGDCEHAQRERQGPTTQPETIFDIPILKFAESLC